MGLFTKLSRRSKRILRLCKGTRKPVVLVLFILMVGFFLQPHIDMHILSTLSRTDAKLTFSDSQDSKDAPFLPHSPVQQEEASSPKKRGPHTAPAIRCNAGDLNNLASQTRVVEMRACERVVLHLSSSCGGLPLRSLAKQVAQKNGVKVMETKLHSNLSEKNIALYKQYAKPLLYIYEGTFVDFALLEGTQLPIYITFMCDPIDTALGEFKTRPRNMSLSECLQKIQTKGDCLPSHITRSFVCGDSINCRDRHSRKFINQAKRNLVMYYGVGGVASEMEEFSNSLEAAFPHIFKGLTNSLSPESNFKMKQPADHKGLNLSSLTETAIATYLEEEVEFYQFVKLRFHNIASKLGVARQKQVKRVVNIAPVGKTNTSRQMAPPVKATPAKQVAVTAAKKTNGLVVSPSKAPKAKNEPKELIPPKELKNKPKEPIPQEAHRNGPTELLQPKSKLKTKELIAPKTLKNEPKELVIPAKVFDNKGKYIPENSKLQPPPIK